MASDSSKKTYDVQTYAEHFDPDDLFAFGANYFPCGWGKEQYYNYSFSKAIALIGSLYGNKASGRSDYHNGVVFISNELGVTKRQVKVLRKKMKYKNGYVFRTPYSISATIYKIIDLLKKNEQDSNVNKFLTQQSSNMYREILIEKQFESIKEAAKNGNRKKVKKVADELRNITIKVGETKNE